MEATPSGRRDYVDRPFKIREIKERASSCSADRPLLVAMAVWACFMVGVSQWVVLFPTPDAGLFAMVNLIMVTFSQLGFHHMLLMLYSSEPPRPRRQPRNIWRALLISAITIIDFYILYSTAVNSMALIYMLTQAPVMLLLSRYSRAFSYYAFLLGTAGATCTSQDDQNGLPVALACLVLAALFGVLRSVHPHPPKSSPYRTDRQLWCCLSDDNYNRIPPIPKTIPHYALVD